MTKAPRKTAKPVVDEPDTAAPEPAEVVAPVPATDDASDTDAALKLRDLLAGVAKATGARPAAVKPAVEATLAALGEALRAGRAVNLPGFGKAKVSRADPGKPLTVKIKTGTQKVRPTSVEEALGDDQALADDDD